ncbi:hypothetical protein DPEC_G00322340 [Dallia pectoralis]|uniref:Uncharacterized protein n=1 Tax=Dallia pectoralis TaxID=75939 RepID=A0ACC2FAE3_DALPE|nr:hypothetical protein DPEC_G00322340 [Dallia pectoralis]
MKAELMIANGPELTQHAPSDLADQSNGVCVSCQLSGFAFSQNLICTHRTHHRPGDAVITLWPGSTAHPGINGHVIRSTSAGFRLIPASQTTRVSPVFERNPNGASRAGH